MRVDEHTSGLPHIWLHDENPNTAWIVVNIGALDWCKLAYQFGHELGHVLCNSWQRQATPKLPSQWLEEALVEAFSIRGLGLLADSWQRHPPFPRNTAFADAIRKYRQDLIEKYRKPAGEPPVLGMCAWLRRNRDALDHTGGVGVIEGPEIVPIVAELEGDKACVEEGDAFTVATDISDATASGTTLGGGIVPSVAVSDSWWATSAQAGDLAIVSLGVQK